ncbi:hypothetical protein LAG90_04450 [Marinilongibacter aquaticus]|uniref:hypothetical protein n=1 Tax=Marinilongibacter aquaticus TaxID=2975157 RepID=UPI0021BDEC5F|nr:hypothetical protein [Marinilongibacter aquaticus]UBM59897.1 hypothetical protein LAG90_04450 [Marinilongibacter aquaticus]
MNGDFNYRKFKMVAYSIPLALFLAAAAVYYILKGEQMALQPDTMSTFQFVLPIAILVGILFSSFYFNRQVKKLWKVKNLKEKLSGFQKAFILKMAMQELPATVAVVAALFTGEAQFLFIALAVIIVMIIGVPSKEKIALFLQLSPQEKHTLENQL